MRFMIINKKELEIGIDKEHTEHHMSLEDAKKTALDHLKERPDYYSVAEKAGLEEEGLEEWNDSIFKKGMTGGRLDRLKNKKGAFTVVGTSPRVGSNP